LNVQPFLIALTLALVISVVGYYAGSLSRSGALTATIVGFITFDLGGILPAILLITFFVSSSALTRIGGERKQQVALAFAKGGRRDHGQVLANGGIAAGCAAFYGLTGQELWLVGLAGALATVNADTWSTELGVLARQWPRLITNRSRVEPGTSGGVTREGSMAALGGSGLIGIMASVGMHEFKVALAVIVGGLLGAFADSLLGASVQAIYYCSTCEKQTECYPMHSCGTSTKYVRGWRWLTNDGVNFTASLVGALVAMAMVWLL
jgi:uncharacterized protein (TIGR00297 family)